MTAEYGFLERITNGLDLSGEPLPGQPIVELSGDRRILVENHLGLTQYSSQKICVKVKFGQIAVCGCHLELSQMTRQQLIISGQIDAVTITRRNKT